MYRFKKGRRFSKLLMSGVFVLVLILLGVGAFLSQSPPKLALHEYQSNQSSKESAKIQESDIPQSQDQTDTVENSQSTNAVWNAEKANKLADYMVAFGQRMNQQPYVRLVPYGDNDFGGAMSFAEQNRIMVGEKKTSDSPMANKQKVDVAFSMDGTGTADYLIVDSYGYINDFILYHFTIHDGQPLVLVSQQSQGNPERMYYMYPSLNQELQQAFAGIVNNS